LARLLESERELLANVSHELRTPLARIRVVLETAEESPAQTQHLLHELGVDLADLERLVEDVLDATRLQISAGCMGRLPMQRVCASLPQLIEEEIARQRVNQPHRRMDARLQRDLMAFVDGRLLRHALGNVIQNAFKYSPSDSIVIIEARARGAYAEVSVIDQGVGIPAHDLPNVFRPFYRGDQSRTRETGGVGLGLALTKRICEAHGGSIEVESREDAGTTFRMRFPLDDPRPDMI
jgi:signal transduction histidine kinase